MNYHVLPKNTVWIYDIGSVEKKSTFILHVCCLPYIASLI
jgi:hypothetical protein